MKIFSIARAGTLCIVSFFSLLHGAMPDYQAKKLQRLQRYVAIIAWQDPEKSVDTILQKAAEIDHSSQVTLISKRGDQPTTGTDTSATIIQAFDGLKELLQRYKGAQAGRFFGSINSDEAQKLLSPEEQFSLGQKLDHLLDYISAHTDEEKGYAKKLAGYEAQFKEAISILQTQFNKWQTEQRKQHDAAVQKISGQLNKIKQAVDEYEKIATIQDFYPEHREKAYNLLQKAIEYQKIITDTQALIAQLVVIDQQVSETFRKKIASYIQQLDTATKKLKTKLEDFDNNQISLKINFFEHAIIKQYAITITNEQDAQKARNLFERETQEDQEKQVDQIRQLIAQIPSEKREALEATLADCVTKWEQAKKDLAAKLVTWQKQQTQQTQK